MRTLPGKVVADGPHHVALGGVAPHLEPFLHGPVYHIRCGKDVQQLGIGDHAFGKFVIGKLVGTLDDGHHRTVLLAYLLVAEGDCGMYADILASDFICAVSAYSSKMIIPLLVRSERILS